MSSPNNSGGSGFSVKQISKFSGVTERIKSSNFTLCFLRRVDRRNGGWETLCGKSTGSGAGGAGGAEGVGCLSRSAAMGMGIKELGF